MPVKKFCDCYNKQCSNDGSAVCGVCGGDGLSIGADFYQFVNNKWLADESITIPAEYSSWGSFIKLVDESLKNQIGLLKDLQEREAANPDEAKLGLVWQASMQRFKAWEAGEGTCDDIMNELHRLGETVPMEGDGYAEGLAKYLGRCNQLGIKCPVEFGKEANLKDTENIVLDLSPSGLSLPSRDYYLDDKFDSQRGLFEQHLKNVAELIGAEKLEGDFPTRVIRIETKLAQIQMKPDQSRQFDQYFNVTTLDGLIKDVNSLAHLKDKDANYAANKVVDGDEDSELLTKADFPVGDEDLAAAAKFWEFLFTELQLRSTMAANYDQNYPGKGDKEEAQYRMMVFDGDYFRRVLRLLLRTANRKDIMAYLQYQVIKSGKEFCTKALNEEFFDFYARKLAGQQEQKTPEKRTIALISAWMGELLGKIYVTRFFSAEDKETVKGMVMEVLEVMKKSLEGNDWLTAETKALAQKKLSKFIVKLGYPDKWKNYDTLELNTGDSLFTMHQKVSAFDHQLEFLEKLNSVKDKTKWEMNPQDVNAYFHPLNNEIVFPAAIMQPPFYQRSMDAVDFDLGTISRDVPDLLTAINFGGIGAVIAHEITHGYDDQGRKFDADGNINDWWQEEDAALFKKKCDLMAEQAATWKFEDVPEDGAETKVHTMNGELTMGENLADLGGMSLACQALQKRCGDGISRDHYVAFFHSWANIWKSKNTKADVIKKLATDPHAPPSFRGNLVKNVDAFYTTFSCAPGDAMYVAPEKRVQMW